MKKQPVDHYRIPLIIRWLRLCNDSVGLTLFKMMETEAMFDEDYRQRFLDYLEDGSTLELISIVQNFREQFHRPLLFNAAWAGIDNARRHVAECDQFEFEKSTTTVAKVCNDYFLLILRQFGVISNDEFHCRYQKYPMN